MPPFLRTTLFIILVLFQITACSSEANSSNGKAKKNNGGVNNGNNSSAAIISGVDTGSVTEDVDPDGDGQLAVGGQLTISDNNPGEAAFSSNTINGKYGRFAITINGDWYYHADNSLAAIQDLSAGESIKETLRINSVDGTPHDVTITIHGADELNQPASISGVDSATITKDLDSGSGHILSVLGKLNITDIDEGEASFIANAINGNYGLLVIDTTGNWFYTAENDQSAIQSLSSGDKLMDRLTVNSVDGTAHNITITILGIDDTKFPAIIGGNDKGDVTEDDDPDGDDLLSTNGTLSISDENDGEAIFNSMVSDSSYGRFILTTAGVWFYAADNTEPAIQNLDTDETLTDTITVSSVDGTTHDIVITIHGVDEASTSSDIRLSWTAPIERADDTALSLSEIGGYNIYYGSSQGQYDNSISINDGSAVGHTFKDYPAGTYYFVITTVDTGGRESQHSSEIIVNN